MHILSIQSHVAYGHVGNSAAIFPMQRLGVDVWPIHTVQFSNHTGYGDWKGRVFDGPMIEDIVQGIADRGALAKCDRVVSGYMGSPDIGQAILSVVSKVRLHNSKALYCCDPVIGDVGRGIFVRPLIPEFMKEQALPAADLITPNQFELDYLTNKKTTTLIDLKLAINHVQTRMYKNGPAIVLVTSLQTENTPSDAIDLMAADRHNMWQIRTPKLNLNINGAGDMIAALFFVHYNRSKSVVTALEQASASVYGVLKQTYDARSREILLVDTQEEYVAPSHLFKAQPV